MEIEMKQYRYALFDMDGTLLESMQYWRNIVFDWVQRHQKEEFPEEERRYLEEISVGRGLKYIQERYQGTPIGKISWEGLFEVMAEHYRQDVEEKPGAEEILKKLQQRGIPMGIVTGTPHHLADIALKKAGMEKYFEFVLSPDEFPEGKTKEPIFREALSLLKANTPSEVVFFEDQLYSIRTARDMGFYIIAPKDFYAMKDKEQILKLADTYWEKMGWQEPLDVLFP